LEREYLADLGRAAILVPMAQCDGLARAERAATDAPDTNASDIRVVVEGRDLQLKRGFELGLRRRNVLQHRLEKRAHVPLLPGRIGAGPAVQGGCVYDREVELLVRGAEFVEE